MTLAYVPRESRPGETRIAASPETVKRLVAQGVEVALEPDAGTRAGLPDALYLAVGARLATEGDPGAADLILKVRTPELAEIGTYKRGAVLLSLMAPAFHQEEVGALVDAGITTLAMDLVPRITRAQSMDALSSQATVAGYKAVLLGANHLRKFCPLLMTAAGTVPPARVVVFGAGVAGLMAIATARRLGCVVEATDVRMAAKEQVESLGARFIDVPGAEDMEDSGGYAKEQSEDFLQRQREEVAKRVAEADLVITTAQIPGRRAPVLVSADMLKTMQPGAVLVDMAVESGGNCELSEPGQVVEREGVTLVGVANLPATVPQHASELYAKNVLALLKPFLKDGQLELDFADEVIAGCRLTHDAGLWHAPTAEAMGRALAVEPTPTDEPTPQPTSNAPQSAEQGQQ